MKRRVVDQPARQRAVVEVVLVDPDEELVDHMVGPEAVQLPRDHEGAVG